MLSVDQRLAWLLALRGMIATPAIYLLFLLPKVFNVGKSNFNLAPPTGIISPLMIFLLVTSCASPHLTIEGDLPNRITSPFSNVTSLSNRGDDCDSELALVRRCMLTPQVAIGRTCPPPVEAGPPLAHVNKPGMNLSCSPCDRASDALERYRQCRDDRFIPLGVFNFFKPLQVDYLLEN